MAEMEAERQKMKAEMELYEKKMTGTMESEKQKYEVEFDNLKKIIESMGQIIEEKAFLSAGKDLFRTYIPRKGDEIDQALAEEINSRPEHQKMRIMFLRESEGVYRFGSRRIAITLNKGQPKVRIGGGFMTVSEFIDEYTSKEIDKIQRQDSATRFQNKVKLHQLVQDKQVIDEPMAVQPSFKIKNYNASQKDLPVDQMTGSATRKEEQAAGEKSNGKGFSSPKPRVLHQSDSASEFYRTISSRRRSTIFELCQVAETPKKGDMETIVEK